MGRPKIHDERTERALTEAARAILAQDGSAAVTVRRLAEAAGVSPRAIYSLFGSIEGVFFALYRQAFDGLSASLDACGRTEDPLADLLAAGMRGFRPWALAQPDLFHLVFEDRLPRLSGESLAAGVAAFQRLVDRTARCAAAGLVAPDATHTLAVSFHALCEGLAALELRGQFPLAPGVDPAAEWKRALTALVAGFQAEIRHPA